MLLGLVTSVILARTLGPDGRGLLTAILFWPTFLLQWAYFSLNEATSREVAHVSSGNLIKGNQIAQSALAIHVVSALWVALIIAVVLPLVIKEDHQIHLHLILAYGVAFALLTVIDLFNHAVLQGRGQVSHANALRLVQPGVYASLLVIMLISGKPEVTLVLGAMLVSTLASVVTGFLFSGIRHPVWHWSQIKTIYSTAVRFHGVNVLLYLSTEMDKLVVIHWMNDVEIGYYVVALAYAMLGMGMAVSSFAVLTYADIGSITDKRLQATAVARYSRQAMLMIFLINMFASLMVVWAIPLLYGEAFSDAVPIAAILLFATACKGLRQVLDRALRACLNTRIAIKAELASIMIFGLLLLFSYRLVGELASIAIAIAVSQLLSLIFLMRGVMNAFSLSLTDMWGLRPATLTELLRIVEQEARTLVGASKA